jgi:hypothetical protein
MNKHLLPFLVFIIPILSFTQEKRDTKIKVIVIDTTNLFNRLASYLYENDYSMEEKDPIGGFLLTKARPLKKANAYYKIKTLAKDSTLIISGLLNMPVFGKDFDPVEWTKSKSLNTEIWKYMVDIANHFGKRITYIK